MAPSSEPDPVLDALDHIIAVMNNDSPHERLADRTKQVRALRASGLSYREIADHSLRPPALNLVDDYIESLSTSATRLRRALIGTLRDEDLTMIEIGELLGVTRQRVSQILRANDH